MLNARSTLSDSEAAVVMEQSNAESGHEVVQHRKNSHQALSTKVLKSNKQRSVPVPIIRFLVDSENGANTYAAGSL